MKQEEKELLIKDLCARLLYGLKCRCDIWPDRVKTIATVYPNENVLIGVVEVDLDKVKPYLRPMSSMTEEEQQDFKKLICKHLNSGYPEDEWSAWLLYDKTGIKNGIGGETLYFYEIPFIYDWLNAHHFDYRGLIKKGLALEAPEGMYNIK